MSRGGVRRRSVVDGVRFDEWRERGERKKNVGRFDKAGLFGYTEFFSRLTFFSSSRAKAS